MVAPMRTWTTRFLLALTLASFAGCSSPKPPFELVRVKGKVTFQGQPLAEGDIVFQSADGSKNATGEIKDGQYELSTFRKGDGVAPGHYQVSVTAWQTAPEMGTAGVPSIPAKYLDPSTSQLTADVKNEASQEIDFSLTGEGA